jgi:ankyrin repeat protein
MNYVENFLEQNASNSQIKDHGLIVAARCGNLYVVKYLLALGGVNIDCQDYDLLRKTPLMWALDMTYYYKFSYQGPYEGVAEKIQKLKNIVEILRDKGASFILKDSNGMTAKDYSSRIKDYTAP